MSFRPIIIITLLGALSACGHIGSKRASEPIVIAPPISESIVLEQPEPHEQEQVNNPVPIENSAEENSAAQETIAYEVVVKDLFSRIRTGFRFPQFDSAHVNQYEKWNSQHPTYLKDLFIRAEPFLFFIVEEIEKRGLPMELVLLPAVESAYKPKAVSRSAAGGLWQFIPSTGRYYGLRQDWWYDGRRDAIAATNAALDYLTTLNEMFEGDWLLALAAYNAGPGTVRKAIKYNTRKGRPTNYSSLNLRAETVRYVPKLFALRNIILNPGKYGVTLPLIENKPHFKIVNLPGQIDLHQFAEQSSVDLAALQHLNAGFKRWATSPDGPHRLLIPLSSNMMAVGNTLANLESAPQVSFRNHRIEKGDTLSSIAHRYSVSISALKTVNKMTSNSIRTGRNLLIPASRQTREQVARRSSQSQSQLVAIDHTQTAQNAQNYGSPKLVHMVVAGDTLWSIARRYQVKVTELLSWNKLNQNQILSLNQALLIFTDRS